MAGTLVTNTVTADTSGNVFIPTEPDEPGALQQIYIVAPSAVLLQGQPGSVNESATIPANTVVAIPGRQVYVRAPSATVAVSYWYLTNS